MVSFPVYVSDDAHAVILFPSFEKMQGSMERIDVENNEYQAWDATGHVLELTVEISKSEWLKIAQSDRVLPQSEFAEIKAKAVPYRDPEPLLRNLGRALGIVRN